MNRLTKKVLELDNCYTTNCVTQIPDLIFGVTYTGTPIIKLGKLEDIEEELGCPLEVLWKIRNQEFVYVDGIGKCKVVAIHIEPRTITNIEYYNRMTKDTRLLFVSDYKEEFWLKEDKSE